MAAKRHAQGLKLPSDINKKTVNDEELVSCFLIKSCLCFKIYRLIILRTSFFSNILSRNLTDYSTHNLAVLSLRIFRSNFLIEW